MNDKTLQKLYVGKIGVPVNGSLVCQGRRILYHNKRNHYVDIDTGLSYPLLPEHPNLPKYGVVKGSLEPLTTYVQGLSKLDKETTLNGTRQKKLKFIWRIK